MGLTSDLDVSGNRKSLDPLGIRILEHPPYTDYDTPAALSTKDDGNVCTSTGNRTLISLCPAFTTVTIVTELQE